MKLKYYFRGLGTGILFATIVLFISYSYRMSDSQIKKEAEKLGMVYAGSEDGTTGFVDSETTNEKVAASDGTEELTSSNEVNSTTLSTSTEPSESQTSTTENATTDNTTEPTTENTTEPTTTESPTTTTEPQSSTEETTTDGNSIKCELKVTSRTSSYDVAYALHAAGIIDNVEKFDDYLCKNGYATKIQNGTYTITGDMSYEDIAKLITTRRY